MSRPKASPRLTAARVKKILALFAAKSTVSAIASKFGMARSTVARVVERGEDHCALKNQAMTRAIKEAVRMLARKPKERAPGRGKRVAHGKIISVKEVRDYLMGHAKGLKIKAEWIPAQRTFESIIGSIPRASRTRMSRKKAKVSNSELTAAAWRSLQWSAVNW